jgi:hypothetical protein
MNRKHALEDLFLTIRKDLLNKGVIKENAEAVARAIYMRATYDDNMTIEKINAMRDAFIK